MHNGSKSWLPVSAAAAQVWALDQLSTARSTDGRRNGSSSGLLAAVAAQLGKLRSVRRSNGRS